MEIPLNPGSGILSKKDFILTSNALFNMLLSLDPSFLLNGLMHLQK